MIDLHLHLDGSLSEMTMRKISAETGERLPDNFMSLARYDVKSGRLSEYLKCFDLPLSLLQTPENLRYSVITLLEELAHEHVTYAEIRFAPQLHLGKGYSQRDFVLAAVEALTLTELLGIRAGLILCLMCGGSDEANGITVSLAEEFLGKGVVALDLAGDEASYPVRNYAEFFKYAAKHDIPFTIHAGEAAGAWNIEDAIRLGAKRIGHGIAAKDDNELIKYLAKHEITLELCPSSNIQTGAVRNFKEEYPLVRFFEAGVPLTINTDNRTVSDTDLKKEFKLIRTLDGVDDAMVNSLIAGAKRACFMK